MVQIITFIGTLVVCALLLWLAVKLHSRNSASATPLFSRLPSGKELPEDAELLRLSKEQLDGFVKDDLKWLEEYALDKKKGASSEIQDALWGDLLRRIDIALNGF